MRIKQRENLKKLFRILKLNGVKNINQPVFFVSIILFFVLCFFSIAYLTPSRSYSVIELLLYFDNNKIGGTGLSSIDIILAGIGEYSMLFAPIISSLPSILIECKERRNYAIRFSLYRTGTHLYNTSFTLSAMAVGGADSFSWIFFLFGDMSCTLSKAISRVCSHYFWCGFFDVWLRFAFVGWDFFIWLNLRSSSYFSFNVYS